MWRGIQVFAICLLVFRAAAGEYSILDFGAVPNDGVDDTDAIEQALEACRVAGGGAVRIPAGTFLLSRRNNESPILEMPANTTLCGVGNASTLKFTDGVHAGNFWRMIGAPVSAGTRNVTIRDLHLDGSNRSAAYVKGKTHEHNAGIWFYNRDHPIENILVERVFAENFSGDCMAFSYNCRAITVRDCTLRNFLRQGIQLGGSPGSRDYLVTGCRDLEHTVRPGGSTIHVEHARGLKNVIIENNQCRHSILAGGVQGMIIRGNTIRGRFVGNSNSDLIIQSNILRCSMNGGSAMQLGYTRGLSLSGNIIDAEDCDTGVYIWGTSRYNSQPGERILVTGNQIRAAKHAISLNGTVQSRIQGNQLDAEYGLWTRRSEQFTTDLEPERIK